MDNLLSTGSFKIPSIRAIRFCASERASHEARMLQKSSELITDFKLSTRIFPRNLSAVDENGSMAFVMLQSLTFLCQSLRAKSSRSCAERPYCTFHAEDIQQEYAQ